MPICKISVPSSAVTLLTLLTLSALSHNGLAEDWPQWRGPRATGVSGERGIPLVWNEHRGVLWRAEVAPWGNSTPAIYDWMLFVTTHTHDGQLLLEARRVDNGSLLWQRKVGEGVAPREAAPRTTQKFHRLHNYASPSPVTNGEVVVAHFGNGDLAVYDMAGERLWKRNLQDDYGKYTIWWGHANSPVIYKDLVVSVCMQDSLKDIRSPAVESYVVAHDLKTGQVRWYTPRNTDADAEECDAYTTPLVVPRDTGDELVVMGGNQLDAYNPRTGEQLWFLPRLKGGRTVTGPTVAGNMIFTTIGMRGPLLGIDYPTTRGKLDRDVIRWTVRTGTPDSCSPVVWRDWVFVITDQGVARCYHAKHGRLEWTKRLKGQYKASPVAVDGHILFLNTSGLCTIVAADSAFRKVSENQLPDTTLASPAVSNGRLYIRGHEYLWCIGRK